MKTHQVLMLGVVLAGGYFYMKNRSIEQKVGQPRTPVDKSVFPLKEGDSGIFVENVQKALINKGGDIAHLILSGGGVTGIMNEQTVAAIKMEGLNLPLEETAYRQLISNVAVLRNYAYVIDVDGAPIYAAISNSYVKDYGYGRDLIMTLPARTYIGVATGNFANSMIELTTTINTKKVKFWTPSEKVGLLSQAEYDGMKNSRLLEKSEQDRTKLLKL